MGSALKNPFRFILLRRLSAFAGLDQTPELVILRHADEATSSRMLLSAMALTTRVWTRRGGPLTLVADRG
jgi:hypothetical protein